MSSHRETYLIRAVAEDCSDLLALRRRWFPAVDDDFDRDFSDWWAVERHHRHAVVCYAGDEPVGMANGQIFTRMPAPGRPRATWMYGANVYVADDHRRRGLGHLLMTALIDFAETNGMVRVVLAPSDVSIPLYESLGFRPAHDLMRLDLDVPPTDARDASAADATESRNPMTVASTTAQPTRE